MPRWPSPTPPRSRPQCSTTAPPAASSTPSASAAWFPAAATTSISARRATALEVGRRYGSPVLLEIDARDMHLAGHLFHQAENGVWLTERVPVRFIREA